MGKLLEEFALITLVDNLNLGDTVVRPLTSKRKKLWDAIVRTRADELENIDGSNNSERWELFKQDVPGHPDGLLIDETNETAYFLEIEDTNYLTESKLNRYVNAWWLLDSAYWTLVLIVANRYGCNHHEIDLRRWWFFVTQASDPDIAAKSAFGSYMLKGMNAR
jgi:hypothetical protein